MNTPCDPVIPCRLGSAAKDRLSSRWRKLRYVGDPVPPRQCNAHRGNVSCIGTRGCSTHLPCRLWRRETELRQGGGFRGTYPARKDGQIPYTCVHFSALVARAPIHNKKSWVFFILCGTSSVQLIRKFLWKVAHSTATCRVG